MLLDCVYLGWHQENSCISTHDVGVTGEGEEGDGAPVCLMSSGCGSELSARGWRAPLERSARPDGVRLTRLPEQGAWLPFKRDPVRAAGELEARETSPAESAGGEGAGSRETCPGAEQRH